MPIFGRFWVSGFYFTLPTKHTSCEPGPGSSRHIRGSWQAISARHAVNCPVFNGDIQIGSIWMLNSPCRIWLFALSTIAVELFFLSVIGHLVHVHASDVRVTMLSILSMFLLSWSDYCIQRTWELNSALWELAAKLRSPVCAPTGCRSPEVKMSSVEDQPPFLFWVTSLSCGL